MNISEKIKILIHYFPNTTKHINEYCTELNPTDIKKTLRRMYSMELIESHLPAPGAKVRIWELTLNGQKYKSELESRKMSRG